MDRSVFQRLLQLDRFLQSDGFFWLDHPGGYPVTSFGPHAWIVTDNSQVSDGDVVYYNWGTGTDHVSIRSGRGYDPNSGWYGDWIDQHTTDRRSAYWALTPYNGNWYTTKITVWHVWSGN